MLMLSLSLAAAFRSTPYIESESLFSNSVSGEKKDRPLPVRIRIPRLNVDAPVGQAGLAPDGTMEVPALPGDTAWYNLGPRPGEIGSAVIDGHSGWREGKPAVFDYLYKLRQGDKIYIEDENGEITLFLVQRKETYKADEDAFAVFGSIDGGSYLNLITCSGTWDKIDETHPDRLVVFAEKEM